MKSQTFHLALCFLSVLFILHLPVSSQVIVNEYSVSNLSSISDNYSKYEDWIELYNPGASTVDIGGYFLSDKLTNIGKWQIPAGTTIAPDGFLIIWASGRDEASGGHYHSNFKLTQTKDNIEYIMFSNPFGVILEQIELQITQKEHSRGRTTNGAAEWGIFTTTTPGSSNNASYPYSAYSQKPVMSMEAGFYSGSITVGITTEEPNSTIHYTTDGSEPTASSPIYSGSISITSTTIVNARTISNNSNILDGLIEFNTYFINVSHQYAVMSTSAAQLDNLLNGSQSLRPFGTFEYFNEQGVRTTYGYGEFNEHGQDSWVHDQRSIDYITRDECGYNYAIRENLISITDRDKFQRIILRAAGDDNYPGIDSSALLRDFFVQNTAEIGGLNLDVRKGEKGVLYVNGIYWGIYGYREKVSDHDFTDYYYNQDKYHLQFLKLWGWSWAEYGGQDAWDDWNTLHDFIKYNDMSNQGNFEYVKSQYDYTSLVDYIHINSFVVCSDWINWNVGWWRGTDPAGGHQKWGYILWDEDATFAHYINYTGVPEISPTASPCFPEGLTSDPEEHIFLLNRLIDNPEFYQYYVTRYIDLYNTVFQPDRMINYLDTIAGKMAIEMPNQVARWGGSVTQWENNIEKIRNFITTRYNYLPTGFIDCYGLSGPYPISIDVEPAGVGFVQLNSLELDTFVWSGEYFGGIENKLKAIATHPNYEFDQWILNNNTVLPNNTVEDVTLNLTMGDFITARFKQIELVDSILINEINYNSTVSNNTEDWLELKNISSSPINISGWIFKDELDINPFEIPGSTIIEADHYFILCEDTAQFKTQFPGVTNYTGNFEFGLSGGGELIRLFNSSNELIDSVHYDDSSPWPKLADGYGPTLELKHDSLFNDFPESWRESYIIGGTPGMPNSVKLPVQLSINEFMADNDNTIADPQGNYDDWIELYNGGEQYFNIGGKYITDSLNNPTDWQISNSSPDSTIILPGEYLLLWADKNTFDGVLHLDIKLAASGEQIGIFDVDGLTVIDTITFGTQLTDISFGRIPNGGDELIYMSKSTPGESNTEEINLNLDVFLEGPFVGAGMNANLVTQADFPYSQPYNTEPWNYSGGEFIVDIPNQDIVDWVLIEIREATEPALANESSVRTKSAGFLLKDGTVTDTSGSNYLNFDLYYSDSLYVVVKHRNHLGVISAFALEKSAALFNYDFTSSAAQTYGGEDAVIEIASEIWGLISGDANTDGMIDILDKDPKWLIEAGLSGYLNPDLNLDTQVNNQDKNDNWLPNLYKGTMVPE